jgi:hypothetical protein
MLNLFALGISIVIGSLTKSIYYEKANFENNHLAAVYIGGNFELFGSVPGTPKSKVRSS